MKDKIKEILDNPKILMLSYGNYISLDDYVKLKDYITNLQQENERLKESIEELTNRNVKASVYILENIKGNYFKRYDDEIYKMCADLLNILKGDDENEKRK
jgi:hypothetical protein